MNVMSEFVVFDNFPIFLDSLVMILNATDADEPNHLNSKIAFKIISQEPAGMPMFLISRNTGEVRTLTSSLDREVKQVTWKHQKKKILKGLMASNLRMVPPFV